MPKPTLHKFTAADGQEFTVTSRVDRDGILRIDVFRDKKQAPLASVEVRAKDAPWDGGTVGGVPKFNAANIAQVERGNAQ